MSKEMIANPPGYEYAAQMGVNAPVQHIPITQLVRTAIHAVLSSREHYEEFIRYFRKGEVTGSTQADLYAVARLIVNWEDDANRPLLATMLKGEKPIIRLIDIVKRITPELRRLSFDVQRGVIVGVLTHQPQQQAAA